jgi:hypothetical protein
VARDPAGLIGDSHGYGFAPKTGVPGVTGGHGIVGQTSRVGQIRDGIGQARVWIGPVHCPTADGVGQMWTDTGQSTFCVGHSRWVCWQITMWVGHPIWLQTVARVTGNATAWAAAPAHPTWVQTVAAVPGWQQWV